MSNRQKISEKVKRELYSKAGCRCSMCNKDLTYSYIKPHDSTNIAQEAHINAYSPNGPRSDIDNLKDNCYDNLILLCYDCHHTVDTHPDEYDASVLEEIKIRHEEKVRVALDSIKNPEYDLVICSSPIKNNNSVINTKTIDLLMIRNDLSIGETINLLKNTDSEESDRVIDFLDANFKKRISNEWDSGTQKSYCIFGLAPMHVLIKLGSLFSNFKGDLKIAIKSRSGWLLDNKKPNCEFIVKEPERNSGKKVVLEIATSAPSNVEEIKRSFPDCDHWLITIEKPGIDRITSLSEVDSFGTVFSQTIDKITRLYGHDVEINMIPRACNAIAIQTGRFLLPKNHPKIKVYDAVNGDLILKVEL